MTEAQITSLWDGRIESLLTVIEKIRVIYRLIRQS